MTTLRWVRHPDFPEAKAPRRAHPTDAGIDVFAAETVVVRPGEVVKCRTGLCLHPEPVIGFEADAAGYNREGGWTYATFVWDKSGLASRGLTTLGGVIDDAYTGEIIVVVTNLILAPVLKVVAEAGDRTIRKLIEAFTDTDVDTQGGESEVQRQVGAGLRDDALSRLFNIEVKAGEKLAQVVVQRVELATIEREPRELSVTGRGAGGFASTGCIE